MRWRGIRRSCSGRWCRSIGSAATTWRPRSPTHCAPQLIDANPTVADKNSKGKKLKHDIISAIGEMIHEMDTCYDQIADQAVELIHQNEVILTLGSFRTVKEFLLAAKEKNRSFHVYVAEGAPRYQGHIFAKVLLEEGLQTTVITDSAIFAMVS